MFLYPAIFIQTEDPVVALATSFALVFKQITCINDFVNNDITRRRNSIRSLVAHNFIVFLC